MPEKKFHILVAPLDWGIGHATRCVPIIRLLQKFGALVTIAAQGRSQDFLRGYFPEATFAEPPGFKVSYPSQGSMILKMLISAPAIVAGIRREHVWLDRYIFENKVDAVISDNRFGFWSKRVPSIYITHQVTLRMPAGMTSIEPLVRKAHGYFIRKYRECWIPDFEGTENLSGFLSHTSHTPKNASFIGPLTRFADKEQDGAKDQGPDLLVILSGPEPQRTILEMIIMAEIMKYKGLKSVLLRGVPGEGYAGRRIEGLDVYPHLPDDRMASLVRSAGKIICRPGYSTIMDLVCLGRKAILVPTPGQTEQEYLATYLSGKYGFHAVSQKRFNLERALSLPMDETSLFQLHWKDDGLRIRLSQLLRSLR